MSAGEHKPKVGIWWFWQDRLLKSSVPCSEGVGFDRHINGPHDHYSFWPRVQARHSELKGLEYDRVPRGRVIYDAAAEQFYCYTNCALTHSARLRRLVVEGFGLDPRRTVFRQDDHYEDPDTALLDTDDG